MLVLILQKEAAPWELGTSHRVYRPSQRSSKSPRLLCTVSGSAGALGVCRGPGLAAVLVVTPLRGAAFPQQCPGAYRDTYIASLDALWPRRRGAPCWPHGVAAAGLHQGRWGLPGAAVIPAEACGIAGAVSHRRSCRSPQGPLPVASTRAVPCRSLWRDSCVRFAEDLRPFWLPALL